MLIRRLLPLIIVTLFVLSGSFALAQDGQFDGTVAPESLNVRALPGTDTQVIGSYPQGTQLDFIGREEELNNGGVWVLTQPVGGGLTGWVLTDFITFRGDLVFQNIPVIPANTPAEGGAVPPQAEPEAQAAEQQPEQQAPVNNPPPVSGGASISGFSYGAHVANLNNVDLMYYTGMTWVKFQVRHGPGADPNAQAGLINQAQSLGFRILLGVVGDSSLILGGEAYYNDYANYVAGLAALGADAIEIWNEPNLDREWPAGQVSGANYTQLLARSYNAIKAANPNTIVISGAPAPTGFFGGCTPNGCDDAPFLEQMRAAGAGNYLDCVGAHYNEGIVGPRANSGDPRSEYYTRYYPGMVNTYSRIMGRPICFTELGYVTPEGYGSMPPGFEWGNNNTVAEQAQWLADVLSLAAGDSRVRLVIIWNLNYPSFSGDPAGGYSMLRPDGSCPACDAIAARR